jgi:hypothetical protein
LSFGDGSTAAAEEACDSRQQGGQGDETETDPKGQSGFWDIVFANGFRCSGGTVGWDGELGRLASSGVTTEVGAFEAAFFDGTRETSYLTGQTDVVGGVTK